MKEILITLVRAVPDAQTMLTKIIQNIGKRLQGIEYNRDSDGGEFTTNKDFCPRRSLR